MLLACGGPVRLLCTGYAKVPAWRDNRWSAAREPGEGVRSIPRALLGAVLSQKRLARVARPLFLFFSWPIKPSPAHINAYRHFSKVWTCYNCSGTLFLFKNLFKGSCVSICFATYFFYFLGIKTNPLVPNIYNCFTTRKDYFLGNWTNFIILKHELHRSRTKYHKTFLIVSDV